MGIDFEAFQDVLKHPIRRQIILALYGKPSLSYTDLMSIVETRNTGKFNYHLKVLADLIEKDGNGRYMLTEKGRLAAQFLQTFKQRKIEPQHLRMVDAALIGFAGFALTFVNPFFWGDMLALATNLESVPLLTSLGVLTCVFGLVAPGALMWWLTVKRSGSHSVHDLYKAPLVTFAVLLPLFVVFVILMIAYNMDFMLQVSFAVSTLSGGNPTVGEWSVSQMAVFWMGLPIIVGLGLTNSFIGVALAEFASHVRKKISTKN